MHVSLNRGFKALKLNLQSTSINSTQMIDCIYGPPLLHRLMFDLEFAVLFCPSTLNVSLDRSPIEQQTELAKQEPSTIAGSVKPQLTEPSLNLTIKHLTRFFNLSPTSSLASDRHQEGEDVPKQRFLVLATAGETQWHYPRLWNQILWKGWCRIYLLMLHTILCSCHGCQHH